MYMKIILLCLTTMIVVRGVVLPVQKCKLSDSACLKNEFQKALPVFMSGIKEYGIEEMDAMVIPFLQVDLAGLKFTLKNSRMSGLKTAVIEAVEWDTKRQQFTVTYHFTTGTITSHYTATGKVLVLPITGEGEVQLNIDNFQVKMTTLYNLIKGPDGKDYVDPIGVELVEYEASENPQMNLTNLFEGNKELSDRMHAFISEHWKTLSIVFARPFTYATLEIIYKNEQMFFKNVPLSDIAEY